MTAEKKKNEVTQVKNVLYEQARQIAADKQSCEEDLAKAKPALDAAEAALSRISAKDIIGLKALKSPPRMVKVIFDGVLLLRQLPIKKCEMIVEKGTGPVSLRAKWVRLFIRWETEQDKDGGKARGHPRMAWDILDAQ